ncbi:hypothetical protein GETHLI_22120 [Geothrix limicola]|uniref:Uncharacterized protein n=1 Tax=Geothrix limicola TaxID=2927978 RepID=A0ABQ5QH61_9BACT|nr:hypothetical protein [Geothrix limicola]GLH73710.1 hypothetical protein GETHLI_22120 [Geothrix limicola]
MNSVLTGTIILAVVIGLVVFIRSRIAKEWQIQPEDIPQLISKLRVGDTTLAWAQVIAVTDPNLKDSDIALDYSVANGQLEFNWCLLAPKNIEDKSLVIDFMSRNGFTPVEMVAENGCPLIKVTGANIESLANRILSEIYHTGGPLTLIGEGFEWP